METVKCPSCEMFTETGDVCRHCGADLPPEAVEETPAAEDPPRRSAMAAVREGSSSAPISKTPSDDAAKRLAHVTKAEDDVVTELRTANAHLARMGRRIRVIHAIIVAFTVLWIISFCVGTYYAYQFNKAWDALERDLGADTSSDAASDDSDTSDGTAADDGVGGPYGGYDTEEACYEAPETSYDDCDV